ncbi:MAG: DUF4215 domain-containing protein [Candidatus Peribacteraceae bacterium]|nr:DUF4215 domain-containing protein [Candidatus Peribacteraceae bacterium]
MNGTCQASARYCGDTHIDPGEQCDDGSGNGLPNGNCTVTCQLRKLPGCGNGTLNTGEECDNGPLNGRNGNSCSAECRWAVGTCGDGVLQTALHEQCDLGKQLNGKSGQTCTNTCQIAPSDHCGNGAVEPEFSEQCDDGSNNSDTHPSACRLNCTYPRCGDGVQDYNEECDDGNQLSRDRCSPTCEIELGAAPIDNPPDQIPTNIPPPGKTESGPGLVIFLASGAAAGIGIVRRRLYPTKK